MSTPEIDLMRYERWCEREDARVAAIEDEAKRLMEDGEECDPYDVDNFAEAMQNITGEARRKLTSLLKADKPDMTAIGNVVFDFCFDYWCQEADTRAEDIVEGCR